MKTSQKTILSFPQKKKNYHPRPTHQNPLRGKATLTTRDAPVFQAAHDAGASERFSNEKHPIDQSLEGGSLLKGVEPWRLNRQRFQKAGGVADWKWRLLSTQFGFQKAPVTSGVYMMLMCGGLDFSTFAILGCFHFVYLFVFRQCCFPCCLIPLLRAIQKYSILHRHRPQ